MKILNILQGTSLGGMEQSSLTLMNYMQNIGCDFDVLSLTPFGKLKSKLDESGISSRDSSYFGPGGILSLFEIRKKIKQSNAEAIMMTGISLVGMLAMGKYCRGKRILAVHFHHEGVKPIFVWKIMYIIACKKFDRITFASNFIRDEAIKIYSNVKNKSEVINNPIQKKEQQTHENRIQSRKKFKLSNDDIVFGNAGWLIKRKRFDVFIKLAREIKNNHPNSKFLIAGDGIEKNNLMNLAEKLEVADSIIWLGWQENLENFYNSLDFMIFNSDWDAVGLSPLESILKGVFTIVSVKNGGIKEILKDEYSYFFFNSHDIKGMSKKIDYAIKHKDKSKELMNSIKKYVQDISDPTLIAKRTLDLYKSYE